MSYENTYDADEGPSNDRDRGAEAKGSGADTASAKEEPAMTRRIIKRYNVMGTHFDVDGRYSLVDVVGRGAYGIVCAARDEEVGALVAIKKISNVFEHQVYTKRTLREIRLLR